MKNIASPLRHLLEVQFFSQLRLQLDSKHTDSSYLKSQLLIEGQFDELLDLQLRSYVILQNWL